jgi:hypothetical protein
MPSTLAVATAILKTGYEDIHDQLDNYIVALNMVELGSKHINQSNFQVDFAARMGRTNGVGSRAENEYLPGAGNSFDARGSIFLRYQYGTIQGTGQVFAQVQQNTAAFVDWMQREMNDIVESLRRDQNRQVYGDGTGTLGLLTVAATTASSITVDDAHFIEIGMTVDVLTASTLGNPTPTSGIVTGNILTVSAVNVSTGVVTFTGGTVTAAIGSAVVRGDYQNGARQNNWNREWQGLGLIVGSGILHNIDPASFPRWLPGYTQSSVGSLTELVLTHLVTGINQQGAKVTDFLTTYGVVYAYWASLQGLRRYDGADRITGGVQTPVFQSVFGDVPITPDFACPKGTLYAVNKSEMFLHQLRDWSWLDKSGTMWQQVPFTDAWKATTFQYSNLGVFRRNTFGKLTGITEQ